MLKLFMEACLSIKFAYLDWLTCKKCLLGGHGKARRTVRLQASHWTLMWCCDPVLDRDIYHSCIKGWKLQGIQESLVWPKYLHYYWS